MGRVIGVVVLLVVLFAIITQPLNSAATVRTGMSELGSAASSMTQFMSSLAAGTTSRSVSSKSSTVSTTGTYRVRPGDTLSSIAAAHGTSASAIAARNGMPNANHVVAGQRLSMG